MDILSCSLSCVAPCRRSVARLAQWRPSALLLPSFVLALCRARAHFCWMFILTHATALIAVSFKTVSHIHCTIFNKVMSPTFVLMLDAEIGETDAAAVARQTLFPVEVNVPVVPELSLAELTQVWTLGVGSDRSLRRPKEWNGEPSGFDDFAFKFSNGLSGLPGDAERFLEESVTMAQPIQWATLTPREKVVAR